MDTAQWAQGIGVVKAMEGSSTKAGACSSSSVLERRTRPVKDQALNCPRCNSTNTKFCYYNNYSLSQPRYFCKTCRRYWTEGGSLRNVPVGGGSRKNKRSSATPASSPSSPSTNYSNKNPKIIHQGQDLNLAYPAPPPPPSHHHHHDDSATEFLRSGINTSTATTTTTSRGLNSFMPMSLSDSTVYSTAGFGAPMQEFIKSGGLNFSLEEGFESGGGYGGGLQGIHHHHHHHGDEEGGARVLFPPSEDSKHPRHNEVEFMEQNSNRTDSTTAGFWNGMLGGASW